MERIIEEVVNKTIINEHGEQEEVLDHTIRYTYNDDTVIVNEEEQVNSTLIKTEKIMPDGTIYLVTQGNGCINQIQIYPPIIEEPKPKTQLELQQESIDLIMVALAEIIGGGTDA
jgi:hypothetical protein